MTAPRLRACDDAPFARCPGAPALGAPARPAGPRVVAARDAARPSPARRRRPPSVPGALLLGLALLATGCARGRGRGGRDAGDGPAVAGDPSGGPGAPAGGVVSLTDQDLAPMDGYLKRRFWVLGDVVEIVASKEYFIQNLSIAARIGFVKREDKDGETEARSVLTFLGRPEQLDFSNAPRVLIGTGISVLARKTLTIRFVRTTGAELPVRIRIAADGDARLGTGSQVTRREPSLVVGAQLRWAQGGYVFEEQGGDGR